jgi:hypothetical protein
MVPSNEEGHRGMELVRLPARSRHIVRRPRLAGSCLLGLVLALAMRGTPMFPVVPQFAPAGTWPGTVGPVYSVGQAVRLATSQSGAWEGRAVRLRGHLERYMDPTAAKRETTTLYLVGADVELPRLSGEFRTGWLARQLG